MIVEGKRKESACEKEALLGLPFFFFSSRVTELSDVRDEKETSQHVRSSRTVWSKENPLRTASSAAMGLS